MQQYLTYLCTDINETGPSLVIFLGYDLCYVVRFFFVGSIKVSSFKSSEIIQKKEGVPDFTVSNNKFSPGRDLERYNI